MRQLRPDEQITRGVVEHIEPLFVVDAQARERNGDLDARTALRQEQARPLLEAIKQQIEAVDALPASKLGQARAYTLTLRPKLTLFLDYPALELSNNLAENSMRPVALGRRHWIHVVSLDAGPKVAAILSGVETSRRLSISLRHYLADPLPGLAAVSIQKLAGTTSQSSHRETHSAHRDGQGVVGLTLTLL